MTPYLKRVLLSMLFSGVMLLAKAQNGNVGIGTTTPNQAAVLDVVAPNKGLLIPRVSLANIKDRVTIPNPVEALLVYNTNKDIANGNGLGFYYWSGPNGSPVNEWIYLTPNGTSSSADGSKIFNGSGIPSVTIGKNSDLYIDNNSGNYYQKDSRGNWNLAGNLKGPQGLKGDPGVVGVQGMAGTSGTPGTPGTPGGPGEGVTIVTNDSGTWVYNPTTNTWTNINGAQGPQGEQGLVGAQGPQGPQGLKGDPGVVGVQGMAGTSGTPGTPGTPGGPGEGVTIVTNDSGTWVYNPTTNTWTNINGAKGDKGDKGEMGYAGGNGQPGAAGLDGSINVYVDQTTNTVYVRDPNNPDNWIPINGAKGAKGDKGDKGEMGYAGGNGQPGAAGLDGSINVYVDQTTNTVYVRDPNNPDNWIPINGAKGAKGDKGDKGEMGYAGGNGQPGAAGLDGSINVYVDQTTNTVYVRDPNNPDNWIPINGAKGDKGDPGVVGVQGMAGTSGTPGTPGTPGGPGEGVTIVTNDSGTWVYNPTTNTWTNINGAQGPQGEQGLVGAQGPQGPQGLKGDPGVVGVQGMAGTSGTPGTPGTPGGPGEGVTIVTNDSGTWVYNPTTNTWTNINGAKGDKGDKGEMGYAGGNGQPGAAGLDGSINVYVDQTTNTVYVRDPNNPDNWIPINGAKGAKGDKGDKGEMGYAGGNGQPGAAGLDGSINVYVDQTTNTVYVRDPNNPDNWIPINGAKGAKGDKGDKGEMGYAGGNGQPGAAGLDGSINVYVDQTTNTVYVRDPNNPDNWIPINGAKGDKGDPGVVGVQGMAGTSGTPGTPGTPGGPGEGVTIVTNDSGTWVYNPTTNTWTNINGAQGPQGPQGLKGDPGVVGVQGMAGTSGTPGTPGTPGGPGEGVTIVTNDSGTWVYNPTTNTWTNINGAQGPQGPQGLKGDPGVVGVQGMAGTSGTPGTPGTPGGPGEGVTIVTNDSGTWVYNPTTNTWTNINGAQGPQGEQGLVGAQGPQGPQGLKGDPGVVGVQGMAGTSGTPGTPGTPGGPGEGVTIVTNDSGTWVYNPTTNTWTNINGAQGPQGEQGLVGAQGPQGPQGLKGDPGVVGVQGMAGTSGTPGTPGTPGGPGEGVTIVTNDSGTWVYNPTTNTWTNINGAQGPQGEQGLVGAQGPQGPQGLKGDPGVVGVQGMAGTSGTPGTPGTPGGPGEGVTIVTNDSGTWVYNPTSNTWTKINGPQGEQGPKGIDGTNGLDGKGISGTSIDVNGNLIITYTDGTTTDAGKVVGPKGIDGTNGLDGKGISGTSIDVNGNLIITYTDGTKTDAGKVIGPQGPQGEQGPQGPVGPPPTTGAGTLSGANLITVSDGANAVFKNNTISLTGGSDGQLLQSVGTTPTWVDANTVVKGNSSVTSPKSTVTVTGTNTVLGATTVDITPGSGNTIMTTDGSGNVVWSTQVPIAITGNNSVSSPNATINVSGTNTVLGATTVDIKPGANNTMMMTNNSGVVTWVDPATVNTKGDNLGNHVATQNLNMSGNNINNIAKASTVNLSVSNGAAMGKVAVSDATGNIIWTDATALQTVDWKLNGNKNGAVKTLGTTDNYDLPLITNNIERVRLITPVTASDTAEFKLGSGSGKYTRLSFGNFSTSTPSVSHIRLFSGAYESIYGFGVSSGQLNYSSGQGSHVFYTGPYNALSQKMIITNSGKVGIGTSNPSELLDVAGDAKIANKITTQYAAITKGFNGVGANTGSVATSADANGNVIWKNSQDLVLVKYVKRISANYTVDFAIDDVILVDASNGSVSVGIPTTGAVSGRVLTIKRVDTSSNSVIIDFTAGFVDETDHLISVGQKITYQIIAESSTKWQTISRF